jgi:hypothetical protein
MSRDLRSKERQHVLSDLADELSHRDKKPSPEEQKEPASGG